MSTDGGGGQSVGGISGYIEVSTQKFEADLEKTRKQLERVKREIDQVETAMNLAATTPGPKFAQLQQQLDQLRGAEQGLTQAIRDQGAALQRRNAAMQSTATVTTQVSTAMIGGGKASSNFGQGLLQVGQAVDDVQYGFRSIVNNIPGIVMALGGGAGLGGAAVIAGVGVNYLISHWSQLTEALGISPVKDEVQRMKELADATTAAAAAADRLAKAEEQRARIQELLKQRTPEQTAMGQAVRETIAASGTATATGGELLVKGLAGGRESAGQLPIDHGKIQELEEGVRFFEGWNETAAQFRRDEIERIKREARAANVRTAGEDIDAATRDPVRLRGLIQEIQRNPAAFQPGLAGRLEAVATPEGRQKIKDDEEARKKAEQRQKDIDHEMKVAEIKGRENIKAFDKEQKAREDAERQQQARLEIKGRENSKRIVEGMEQRAPGKARDLIFGLDERVKGDIEARAEAGQPVQQAVAEVANLLVTELQGKGLADFEAEAAAREITGQAGEGIVGSLYRALTNPPEQQRQRSSDVIAAGSFAERIQASIGGEQDTPKRSLAKLEQAVAILERMKEIQEKNGGQAIAVLE